MSLQFTMQGMSWQEVAESGFGKPYNHATRGIEVYRNELYIGTQNLFTFLPQAKMAPLAKLLIIPICRILERIRPEAFITFGGTIFALAGLLSEGCEVWKYNFTTGEWYPVVSNNEGSQLPAGFGNRMNFIASVMKVYRGKLFVGTMSSILTGCEVWMYDGDKWKRVASHGFGDLTNLGVWCAEVYRGELYVGTMNWFKGCQVWKTNDGKSWKKIPLPGGDGFGDRFNVYAWSMEVYQNHLYLGTFNLKTGCQLWRFNGSKWEKVYLPGGDGFGTEENYGIRNMVVYNGKLYIGTASSLFHDGVGCEVWAYDGKEWEEVVGREARIKDGFGEDTNKYAWTMIADSKGNLFVGTLNFNPSIKEFLDITSGCEVWRFNGTGWERVAWNGFGNENNVGARSIIEYPEGSGIIWIGTWNILKGCEVWRS